ncbi:AI-2E family transporter [Antribacter sp. KLBMP9083]|uniref:AI-2E family transporter n=1 Tax=Antribacter soli TaxID=2910976 RepID=A0AA41QH83_9MICO|nr:AI-2E family transporter [Antribacter soli]MCF4123409.1 AI-2E family transporter [Antribacter soli]
MAADTPTSGSTVAWLRSAGDLSWRLVGIMAAVALVFYAVGMVRLVFVAVFLALVLTAVLMPLGNFYDRAMPRALAIGASLLTLLLVVGSLATYVVASIVGSWDQLGDELGSGIADLVPLVQGLPFVPDLGGRDKLFADAGAWVQQNSDALVGGALQSAGSVAEGVTAVVLAVFCTVFFLSTGSAMWQWFLAQVPAAGRDRWQAAASAGWATFSGYTRGISFVALTDAVLAGTFLAIVGVPLALPLSVVVFLAAFVPMVGPVAAIVISSVVALAAEGPVTAIVVAVGMVVIAQLDANVLQPLITGKQVSLHPVVMALVVTCGTVVFGLLGAVVAVPLAAVTWAVFSTVRRMRLAADEVEPEPALVA